MNPFEIVEAHARAWQGLADATAEVAALPGRTLQHLLGLQPLVGPPGADQGDRLAALADANDRLQGEVTSLREEAQRTAREQLALTDELRRRYLALEGQLETREAQARDDQKRQLYTMLEPLLTQLPGVRRAIAQGLPVEAADVVALMTPLDEALGWLGFSPIGAVGEEVAFDPALHQPTAGAPPEPGTGVTVKHVGYQLDARILRKARVARKPPA